MVNAIMRLTSYLDLKTIIICVGLLTTATGGMMGTMEAVGATAIGGVLYALFSGQPITIIGTTGPLLAFLKVLYEACKSQGVPFLTVYAWVGLPYIRTYEHTYVLFYGLIRTTLCR